MTPRDPTRARALPYVPSLVGLCLLLVVFGEWVVFARLRVDEILGPVNLASLAASLPFVLGMLYGGYWLDRSRLSPDRYARVVGWCLGGLAVFVAMNSLSIVVLSFDDSWFVVGWLRWAASIGGGVGLLTGVIEARAIDREIAAERSRVRNRELRRRNDRLEEFASVIAHDLRNPVNVASGRLDLAREAGDDEHLDVAAGALDRMEQIIERTLVLARSGLVVDDAEPVDLADLAADSWETVETVDAHLRVEDAPVVRADPDRLRHVFENLFRNAVEHGSTSPDSQARQDAAGASSGGPSVADAPEDAVEHGSTSPRSTASPEDAVEHAGDDATVRVGSLDGGFYVEDDGPGIPEDARAKVFDAGYSSVDDGTGFGLSIVRQIADAHGWTIDVTDGEHGGARFEFTGVETVPRRRVDAGTPTD